MDDIYVILSILVLSIFIFIILFSPFPYSKNTKPSNTKPVENTVERIKHQSINVNNVNNVDPTKLVCFDPHMQSMNSRKLGAIGDSKDEETLASFYIPGKENVPEDYPLKLVGECPYSKSLSNDLPIPNIPLCIATKNDYNMKLNL